ncbi:MAG: insulinase family protein [Gemmatimonadaceae bacterium]|nr:insulinase family protein [Gemmatimonadaceae bacterium]
MILAGVTRAVLGNGLTVLVKADPDSEVVAVVTYVKAGYFDEPDDSVGISHVLEHMFFKGTPTRGVGEIARQTKASGGYLNAHTIYDHTSYYTVLPAASLGRGIAIQSDAYRNSLIDETELARELEVIIQEAKRKEDNPAAVVTESLYALLHDTHRMRRWRIGREDVLRGLTRERMLAFYRAYYRPSNTILAIAGGVDTAATLAEVERAYGDMPAGDVARDRGPRETGTPAFRYRELSGDVAQTQLALGWRTAPLHDPVTPALDLAAMLLSAGRSSRLYRAVRERQLASSVSASNYTPTDVGVFVIHAETEPEKTADAARGIRAQVDSLRHGDIARAEIDRARRLFESRWIRRLETMEGQAHYLAEWEAQGGWQLGEDYYARFLGADERDVADAAARFLEDDRCGVMIYRPESAPAVAAGAAELRALLQGGDGELRHDSPRAAPAVHTRPVEQAGVEHGVHVFRTGRGLPILVRHRSSVPMAHLAVVSAAGAAHDTEDRSGLALLLARTALKGTATRTANELAAAAELLGGSIATSVTAETLGWSISVPASRLEAAAALLADVIENPALSEEALETERSITLSDLASFRDDMYSYPIHLAGAAAYGAHPYARSTLGTEQSLHAASARDLRERHARSVARGRVVVGIVGDVEPRRAAEVAAGAFGKLEYDECAQLVRPVWPDAVRHAVEERDKAQTALAMAFPAPSRRDDDRFTARLISLLASGLGGRFFDELRERQSLAYTVGVHVIERALAGTFIGYIATAPDKEERAREGLLREFQRLCEELVTEEELERAQEYAVGTHVIRRESNAALLSEMIEAWLFGRLAEPAEFEGKIRSVTRKQVRRLAAACFDPARRAEGVVRGR